MQDEHIDNIYTYEELKELRNSLGDKTQNMDSFIDSMVNYGYLFRAKPKSDKYYSDEDKFIWQRHWLTYGVYELINSPLTRKNYGTLTRKNFDEILNINKASYINKNGTISDKEQDKEDEKILYDKKGIDVLYNIVLDYKWAVSSRPKYKEIIFPHALKLDEPENLNKYLLNRNEDNLSLLEVEFTTLPKDFFFSFVALAEKHISDSKLLWRKGAVLFDLYDKTTFATVIMENNRMKIQISGEHRAMLMQFVTNYILIVLRGYTSIKARILLGVKDEKDNIQMLDTQLMNILDTNSADFANKVTKTIKESSVVNNITVNGNIENMQNGDNNTINVETINKVQEAQKELEKLEQTQEVKELIALAKEIIQNGKRSPNIREKVTKFAKGIVTMDNASNALVKLGGTLLELSGA